MRLDLRLLLALLLAPACTWVSEKDFEARLGDMDDDGDGVPASEDCDDSDPAINPAVPEIWYDGIDQRCNGGDDYDQDGDGFYATSVTAYGPTAGDPETGTLEGGDCDDTNPLVSPIQPDDWYDGVDQNCDGLDDYDQDADGYVDAAYEGLATEFAEGTGALPAGDCDDTDDTVNPEAADEPYDAVDTDCNGVDDFDADDDGFVSMREYAHYQPTQYVNNSGNLPNGDCDDEDASVHPDATDTWYDGIDADCAGDDDFDQDLDTFPSREGGGDDCDDLTATVFPGALETLDDETDSDCNGDPDSFSVDAIPGYTWDTPRAPVFDASSDHVYLSLITDRVDRVDTSTLTYYDSAVALRWDAADIGAGRDGLVGWNTYTVNPSSSVTDGQGFVVSGSSLYGVVGVQTGTARGVRMVRYDPSAGNRSILAVNGTTIWSDYDDLSLVLDSSGDMVAVGCDDGLGSGVLTYVRVSDLTSGSADTNAEFSDVSTKECEVDVRSGETHIYTLESGDLIDYAVGGTAADPELSGSTVLGFVSSPADLELIRDLDRPIFAVADADSRNVLLLDDGDEHYITASSRPTAVATAVGDDGAIYVAWADLNGDAWLAWGGSADDLTSFTTVQLDVAFPVDDVAVYAGNGYVLYAALHGDNVAVGAAAL